MASPWAGLVSLKHTDAAADVSPTRRKLIIGAAIGVVGGIGASHSADSAPFAALESRYGGRLGLLALDTGSGRTLEHRADERFLMCSTFKGLLAAHVLAHVDAGAESLGREVAFSRVDLVSPSPVTELHVSRGALSVETLCQAMVETSDNTAANLLMKSSGGPDGLTRFLRSIGDEVTRVDRFELAANTPKGNLDTTTPRAIVASARSILLGDVLIAGSREKLETWMVNCKPGSQRLRATLPARWQVGNRPGTSVDRHTNDYAIVRPPGRPALMIAAYYDAPGLAMDVREAVLREAGSAVVTWATS